MRIITTILFLLFFTNIRAQSNHPYVSIKEKIKGKRLELFAINTNTISYDIFLRVETEDYRRSSARPVLKTIAPNSETRLITMVKLDGKDGKYIYTMVVNEVGYALSVKKEKTDLDLRLDRALKKVNVTIYTKNQCRLCDETKLLLRNNNIKYSEVSIDKDSTNLIKLIKEFKKVDQSEKAFTPILKIQDSLYTSLKNKQDVINALKHHF